MTDETPSGESGTQELLWKSWIQFD